MGITFKIDGMTVQGEENEPLIDVANRYDIKIPTLCYHKALDPTGNCRICSVEVRSGSWSRLVTACNYPVWKDMEVSTKNERVMFSRRMTLKMLLTRCPQVELIQKLAKEYGVMASEYPTRKYEERCTLCYMCVRACEELIGTKSISAMNRGIDKVIGVPFDEASPTCIGCASCANICPTDAIPYQENDLLRKIWNKEFEMLRCSVCGKAHVTKVQRDYLCKKNGVKPSYFDKCDTCKRKELAHTFNSLILPEEMEIR
jgi:bidirectional [NiFe] hydrogenase diaphorase subunit